MLHGWYNMLRICLILALCLLSGSILALPVLESAINANVYHASASEQRAVTGYYDPTDLGTAINYMTLWNVEDPVYPLQGTTIYESQWIGLVGYRQPTVYLHYLLYLDDNHLHILDIANINSPTQVYQCLLGQMYCFTVIEHYLITGGQDGILTVYDISNPQLPVLVSTTASQPAIWMMWPCGDFLAVRCGNYSNNSAKIYRFSSGVLSEIGSATPGGQLAYVGAWNGRLLTQTTAGNILIYTCPPGEEAIPVADIAGSYQTQKIITDGTHLATLDNHNCVRLWQWNQQQGLCQTGYHDLGHIGLEPGTLCEFKDGKLLYTVDTVLCLLLDVTDPDPDPTLMGTFADGSPYRNIAAPEHGNTIYCEKNNALSSLKLLPDGQLLPDGFIPWTGVAVDVENHRDNLYYLALQDNAYRLKALNIANPAAPLSFADIALTGDAIFRMKDRFIYTGTSTNIEKFVLDPTGYPVWRKQLYYDHSEDYPVYFYDFASSGDMDFGVGWWGGIFAGFHPVLVYWLPTGAKGVINLHKYYDEVQVVGDHLYMLGWGIQIYQLNTCPQPQFIGEYHANILNYGVESSLVVGDRYLILNYQLTNNICIYDLQDPHVPELTHTIRQANNSCELARLGDVLIAANGMYGISTYSLQGVVEAQDELAPAVSALCAYPNPFAGQLNIRFDLDGPEEATIECYNIRGQLVHSQTLTSTRAGTNTALWDGRDRSGNSCPSGVYIIKLRTGHGTAVQKVTMIKGL